MFIKQCRSILEVAVPAAGMAGAIISMERLDIERLQKVALHIILGDQYQNYSNALKINFLETVEAKRDRLCIQFAKKAKRK